MSTFAKPRARLRETALRQRTTIILSGMFCCCTVFISPGFTQTLGEITGVVWEPERLSYSGCDSHGDA
jgi:hypothetical protein